MAKTTADILVERLIEWDVETVFGFPGDGINGIFEALRTREDRIRFIQVRHQEAAAFAAFGATFTRLNRELNVCYEHRDRRHREKTTDKGPGRI